MTDNFIKIENNDILKLEIRTADNKPTGEYLEFDLGDIELPLRYQELMEKDEKNKKQLFNQLHIIDKREDVKGKKLLSKNQEDKIRAVNDFIKKEIEVYNMFLGEIGVQKLLNGQKVTWTSLNVIDDIIAKQIAPKLDIQMDSIADKIKKKYNSVKNEEVLK